jgi:hypothetical protein
LGQNLLASVFVSNTSPTIGSADWSYTNIAPVALTAGNTDYVGSYGSDANCAFFTGGFTVDSRIIYVQNAFSFNLRSRMFQMGSAPQPAVEFLAAT